MRGSGRRHPAAAFRPPDHFGSLTHEVIEKGTHVTDITARRAGQDGAQGSARRHPARARGAERPFCGPGIDGRGIGGRGAAAARGPDRDHRHRLCHRPGQYRGPPAGRLRHPQP
ncbi:hypothetical protein C9E82_21280, partial [Paracoccus siganidrum]